MAKSERQFELKNFSRNLGQWKAWKAGNERDKIEEGLKGIGAKGFIKLEKDDPAFAGELEIIARDTGFIRLIKPPKKIEPAQ